MVCLSLNWVCIFLLVSLEVGGLVSRVNSSNSTSCTGRFLMDLSLDRSEGDLDWLLRIASSSLGSFNGDFFKVLSSLSTGDLRDLFIPFKYITNTTKSLIQYTKSPIQYMRSLTNSEISN